MSSDRKNMSFSEFVDNLRVMNSANMERTAKKSNRLNKFCKIWDNIDILSYIEGRDPVPGILVILFAVIIGIVTVVNIMPINSAMMDWSKPMYDNGKVLWDNALKLAVNPLGNEFLAIFDGIFAGVSIFLGFVGDVIAFVGAVLLDVLCCTATIGISYGVSKGMSNNINGIVYSLKQKYSKSFDFEKKVDKKLDSALHACDELINNKLKSKRFSTTDLERFYSLLGEHEIETLVHLLFNDQLISFEGKSVEERKMYEEKLGLGKTISGVDEDYSVSQSKNEQSNISKSSNVTNIEQSVTQNTIFHDDNRVIHRRVERLHSDSSNMTLSNNDSNNIRRRRSAKYYQTESNNYEGVVQETNDEQISSGRRR